MKSVTLKLRHLSQTPNSTVSALLDHTGERLCYIVEDGYRKVKVMHETRIPAGVYEITPRVDERSRFYTRYRDKFGHKFVPWLINVPGFVWILIHIGNSISDTSGCLLTATYYTRRDGNYFGWGSTEAYQKLYAYLDELFNDGCRVFIEIARGATEKLPEPPPEELPEVEFTEVLAPTDSVNVEVTGVKPPQDRFGCEGLIAAAAFVLLLAFWLVLGNLPQ